MKKSPHPTPAKKPKARVMHANYYAEFKDGLCVHKNRKAAFVGRCGADGKALGGVTNHVVAVLPCATPRQAKELVKLFNMSEEKRVGIVAKLIRKKNPCFVYPAHEQARAVLSACGLAKGGGE